jgi:hypothetical protein
METDDRRQHPRIRDVYAIKFCPEGEHAKWDIAPIKNISEKGILFHSVNHYAPGARMDVIISHPSVNSKQICKASVIRCDKYQKTKSLYEVVIDIEHFDKETKTALYKTIEMFLNRRRDNGRTL